jgi:two-component system, cell cycle sensor histidine kinase and response regulator CckA
MPVMSGAEALRQMRAIRPEVLVILSSGYTETEAARRFAGERLAAFAQKPYAAPALARLVKRVLEGNGRSVV